MPKAVISHKQFTALLFVYVLGASILFIPEATFAGKDAWLSTILGTVIGLIILACWLRLARRHPRQSPVQIVIRLFGPVIGYPVALYLVAIFYLVATLIVEDLIIMNQVAVLRQTPDMILRVTFIGTAIYACYKGVESIARLCELLFIPLTLMVLFVPFLEYNNISFAVLSPIHVINWRNMLTGTLNALIFPLAETLMPMMLIPYVSNDQESEKYYLLAFGAAGFLLLIRTLMGLMIFSPALLGRLLLHFFAIYRQVSLGMFFDRIEGAILGFAIVGLLIKLTITLYVTALGLAQIFRVSKLQAIWLPLGYLTAILPCVMYSTTTQFSYFSFFVLPVFALFGEIILPFLLVIIDGIRSRLKPGAVEELDESLQKQGQN